MTNLFKMTLLSIIFIVSANPGFAQTETKTATTPGVAKIGSYADCKIVVSDGCRNYFLQTTANEIRSKFTVIDLKIIDYPALYCKAEEFTVIFEPSSGGIFAVSFNKSDGRQPAQNLKWRESKKSVQKKYGEARIDSSGTHFYPGFEVYFSDDKLQNITLQRLRTESELAAYNARKAEKDIVAQAKAQAEKAKEEAAEAYANTTEGKAAKLMGHLNVNINYINYLTERHNKIKAGNANNLGAQIIDDNWGEIPKLLKQITATKMQSIDLIDEFLKDHGNKIDVATKSKLLEHRQKFGGNSLKPLPRQ